MEKRITSFEIASQEDVGAFCTNHVDDCGDGVVLGCLRNRQCALGKIVVDGECAGLFHCEDYMDHSDLQLVFISPAFRGFGLLRALIDSLWQGIELPIVADPYDESALAALLAVGFRWRERPWYMEDGVPDRLVYLG